MENLEYLHKLKPYSALTKISWRTCLEIAFGNSCANEINANKELFLYLQDYIIYNIFWLDKLSIIFTYLNSFLSYLNNGFFWLTSYILPWWLISILFAIELYKNASNSQKPAI